MRVALRGPAAILAVLLFVILASTPFASGEHEQEHRFNVYGKVFQPDGTGVCNALVVAYTPGSPEGSDQNRSVRTDGEGRYGIQLHVHSSEVGRDIIVWVPEAGVSQTTTMDFDPYDTELVRQKRVDVFLTEGEKASCPNLLLDLAIWGGIPLLVIGVVVVILLRWSSRTPKGSPLTDLPGLGRATANELGALGIRNVEGLAEADPKYLSENTNLTYRQAKKLVRKAGEMT